MAVPQVIFILISVSLVCLYLLYRRLWNVRRKLSWIKQVPGYPLLGNAFDFADSTKSLEVMHDYVNKGEGLVYIELLNRPLVIATKYDFVEWQLTSQKLLTKSRDYQSLNTWLENGVLVSGGDEWRRSRKILTPAFHFGILEFMVDVFQKPTNILIQQLNTVVDKSSVNLYPYITRYTLDVICQSAMGVQLNVQEDPTSEYFEAVKNMCKLVVERAFNPLKMIDLVYHLSPDYFRERKYVKLLHRWSNEVIAKRRKEIEATADSEASDDEESVGRKRKLALLDLLLKYRDQDGQPLSDGFIRREVDTFMFAGHDTTASGLCFALYCLAEHQDVQNEALAEIRQVLGERTDATFKDLQEMKYLELVLKETLRLYPSVPFYSRETTEEIVYKDGKVIPEGVTLIILAYAINRDPKIFEDPDKFVPTRFLNTEIKPFSYVPFSAGPRNCIGQKFAMLEMKSALAQILLNYRLLPAVPGSPVRLAADTVLTSTNGFNLCLKKRL